MAQPLFDQAEQLLESCRALGLTLATAESCTGGLISAHLTAVAGSSDVFDRGFVTYSYPSKTQLLGVPQSMLDDHGAVSAQVAQAMVEGALKNSPADLAVAVTGVAGPGASDQKPEGLVWFGAQRRSASPIVTQKQFGAIGRSQVREATVAHAFALIRGILNDVKTSNG